MKTAKEFLERRCYVIIGEEYNLASLTMTLLHLSQTMSLSKVVVDGLRATALILESLNIDSTASSVAKAITNLVQPATEQLASTIEDLQRTTNDLRGSAVSITRTADEFVETTASSVQYLTDAAADAASAASQMNEAIKNQAQPPASSPMQTQQQPSSYATAVATGTPHHLAHAPTLAREDARSHQVLIDKAPGATHNGLEDLSEKELVEKARVALELLKQEQNIDMLIQFVGARKLRNGGVIYKMDTAEAARWLKSNTNISKFLQVFSATSVIKQRSYPIIADYIPLSFSPTNRAHLTDIENENKLEPEGILSARWIKPTHRRKQGQRTAHGILGFSQPKEANSAIRNGVVIAGKRVWARKLLQEPRRCLKCQQIGATHIAAECKQTHNTCGNCGEDHCTTECSITDPSDYACKNCKGKGHAAWDRHCPSFVRANATFNTKHPENKYRFYPITQDPTIWETLASPIEEEPPTALNTQQATSTPAVGNHQAEEGWAIVNRGQRQARPQGDRNMGRPAQSGTGQRARTYQHTGLATGANAVTDPANSNSGGLRQTTLDAGWPATNQESTNPTPV